MKYITNAIAVTVFTDSGRKIRVEKSDKKYARVVEILGLPVEEQEDALDKLLTKGSVNSIHGKDGFEIVEDDIFYHGEALPKSLATKVKSIIEDGLPIGHFEKFWENLKENPSSSSVDELVDFLSYKELPITEDGFLVAYKGVKNDYYSSTGNTKTKVLQGKVDGMGRIFNGIGEVIEVLRRDVDDDRSNECSHGLHVGSLDYASGFATKMVLVKVNPADVVSVPKDYSFQKCRVSKYEVLSDFVVEIEDSVVSETGEETLVSEEDDNSSTDRDILIKRVSAYIERKIDDGYTDVTVRQIQNSFSPKYPTKESILDALQELWFEWDEDDGVITVFI
tara:strand:- start:4933 stop:5940 length:1008 start_codon:yes stop_codon:yes gene_type:complete